METLKEKRLAFLEELCGHFNSINRAVNPKTYLCQYSHKFNGGCAIGRKLSAKVAEHLVGSVVDCFTMLPEEMQELGCNFLNFCQYMHDQKFFWNENGLSDRGQAEKKKGIDYIMANCLSEYKKWRPLFGY